MLNATSYPLIYSLSEIVFSIPRKCRNQSTSFIDILFRIRRCKPSSLRLSRGVRGEARKTDPRPHPPRFRVSAVYNRVIKLRGFGASLALYRLLFLGVKGPSPWYCHKVLSSDPFSRAPFKESSPIPHKRVACALADQAEHLHLHLGCRIHGSFLKLSRRVFV